MSDTIFCFVKELSSMVIKFVQAQKGSMICPQVIISETLMVFFHKLNYLYIFILIIILHF